MCNIVKHFQMCRYLSKFQYDPWNVTEKWRTLVNNFFLKILNNIFHRYPGNTFCEDSKKFLFSSHFLSVLLFFGRCLWLLITTLSISPFNWHFLSSLLSWSDSLQEKAWVRKMILLKVLFWVLYRLNSLNCYLRCSVDDTSHICHCGEQIFLFLLKKVFFVEGNIFIVEENFYFLPVRFDNLNLRCRPLLNE